MHFADEVMTQQTSDGSRLASLVVQSLNVTQNKLAITGQSSAVTPGTGGVVRFMSYGNDTQNSKAALLLGFSSDTYGAFKGVETSCMYFSKFTFNLKILRKAILCLIYTSCIIYIQMYFL